MEVYTNDIVNLLRESSIRASLFAYKNAPCLIGRTRYVRKYIFEIEDHGSFQVQKAKKLFFPWLAT